MSTGRYLKNGICHTENKVSGKWCPNKGHRILGLFAIFLFFQQFLRHCIRIHFSFVDLHCVVRGFRAGTNILFQVLDMLGTKYRFWKCAVSQNGSSVPTHTLKIEFSKLGVRPLWKSRYGHFKLLIFAEMLNFLQHLSNRILRLFFTEQMVGWSRFTTICAEKDVTKSTYWGTGTGGSGASAKKDKFEVCFHKGLYPRFENSVFSACVGLELLVRDCADFQNLYFVLNMSKTSDSNFWRPFYES